MTPDGSSFDALLRVRRSTRTFAPQEVTSTELARLLWAGQGTTDHGRTTPSADGAHPLELVVALGRVQGQVPGTARWDPQMGSLTDVRPGDVRAALADASLGDQPWVGRAPVCIAVCAHLDDMIDRFAHQMPAGRERRYAHIEAGAAAQNLALAARAVGLVGVIVGGFDDDAVAEHLRLPSDLAPLLLYCAGRPDPSSPNMTRGERP